MAKAKKIKLPSQSDKSSLVVTSREILKGWTTGTSTSKLWAISPIQMVSKFEKNDEWKMWNLDWFERVAYTDLTKEWKGISKDYDMAEGILDPTDYGRESEQFGDYVKDIIDETQEFMPLMFFPIIPPFINLFVGEYIKRDSRIIVRGVDEFTINKKTSYKKDMIVNILAEKAKNDILTQYQNNPDFDVEDEEQQAKLQEEVDYAQQLVEAENKFKTYETIAEQWANRMLEWDNMRFKMKELQALSFRDSLIADKTFWHIRSLEDDIQPEVWNPRYVFYHKSPDKRWVSETNYAGRQIYLPLSDIFKNYSNMLKDSDYELLKSTHQYKALTTDSQLVNAVAGSHIGDKSNWSDFSKPYPENITDVTYENALLNDKLLKNISLYEDYMKNGHNKDEQGLDYYLRNDLFRVTEVYWRSYKKYGTLVKRNEAGALDMDTIDEDYIVTEKPVYDNSIQKKCTKDNLISGEHIDWYWKPEIRFGVKIARSILSGSNYPGASFNNAIYLSGDPTDLQTDSLPVEGMTLSDRNTKSVSWVRKISPYQICFNIVNNQNIDMLSNNLANGKVIMIDQNYIPSKSFDGSWGKNAMNKWLEVIRNNNIALMDGSPSNNPQGTGFSHFQVLDFSNTPDILRNVQLGEYYKSMALSLIGVTPQRTGTVQASESATGVQTATQNSYAQTEYLFDRHLNELMPRVRQLMLDSEQYLASTKPNVRLSYTNSDQENVLFEIEGSELLLPKLKLHCQSTSDVKALVEKMHGLALQINTAGAEMSDYMKILNSQSPSQIIEQLEKAEDERRKLQEQQRAHEEKMLQEQQAFAKEQQTKELENENYWKEREDATKRYIAEIQELGGIQTDANANAELDSLENLKEYNKQQNFNSEFDLKQQMAQQSKTQKDKEMLLKEKELVTRARIEDKKLEIAKENLTKSEIKAGKR
jgi:hypothetical protein